MTWKSPQEFLRESGTLSASNIGNAYQRVPGEEKIVLAKFPGLWRRNVKSR